MLTYHTHIKHTCIHIGTNHVVSIVRLQHVAHGYDGLLVRIESAHGTDIVQRGGLGWVAIGGCEVHRHDQGDLATTLDELPYGKLIVGNVSLLIVFI